MKHLGRTTCCGYQFTANDIQGRLMNQQEAIGTNDPHLWGGNVHRFANTECPHCRKRYLMWLKIHPPNFRVVTLSAVEPQEEQTVSERGGELPSPDDRQAMKDWLDARGIEYAKNLTNDKLYEKILETQAVLT